MKPSWVISIRDQCQNNEVSFFFKQWGGISKKKAGRELEGRIWDEMPLVHSRNSNYQFTEVGSK
jgi:protein gp37